MAISTNAETIILANPGKVKQNVLENADFGDGVTGWKVQCMNTEKNIESGSTMTTPDGEFVPMKFSNGAEHVVTVPEGFVATKITIYSVINKDAATNRPCFWKKINDLEFTADNAKIATSYKNFAEPDTYEFNLGKVSTISITNTGEQPFVVLKVDYEAGTAGIEDVTVAEDGNAPMYNLQGVQVDENYKGIVIKNGKKYLNK